MTTTELLESLQRRGISIFVKDGNLKFKAPSGVMTRDTCDTLRRRKAEIIQILGAPDESTSFFDGSEHPYDMTAKDGHWLVLSTAEAYMQQVSKTGQVFILRDDDSTWRVWRGDWIDSGGKPTNEKALVQGVTFEEALRRGNSYVTWYRNKYQRRSL